MPGSVASWPSGAIDNGIVLIVLIFPFTRLVHVWNAPFEYFTHRYQVVRSRR